MIEKIKTECIECKGTGLYIGFAEPKGTAIVCTQCAGSGCHEINFKPFTRRKGKHGIKTVCKSCGSFVYNCVSPVVISITYQEFQKGKMP